MPKIKVKQKALTPQDSTKVMRLDSMKLKLGQRVYVGDGTQRAIAERDKIREEVAKLKIEIKKK